MSLPPRGSDIPFPRTSDLVTIISEVVALFLTSLDHVIFHELLGHGSMLKPMGRYETHGFDVTTPILVTWSRSPPIGFSSANFPIFFYLFLTRSKENFEKKSSGNPKIFGKILCFFSSSSVDFSLFFSFQCFTKKKAAPFAISISPLRTSLS